MHLNTKSVDFEQHQNDLNDALEHFLTPQSYVTTTVNLAKELTIVEGSKSNGTRTENFDKLYKALLTIRPTSFACEIIYSVSGNF